MILGLFRISGHSMLPNLKPNGRVIASSIPYLFSKPAIGDVVVFRKGDKMLVKRIKELNNRKITVVGDNNSDSLKIKSIKKEEILGKVILSFRT